MFSTHLLTHLASSNYLLPLSTSAVDTLYILPYRIVTKRAIHPSCTQWIAPKTKSSPPRLTWATSWKPPSYAILQTLQVGQRPQTGIQAETSRRGELMFKDDEGSARRDRPSKVETQDRDGPERPPDQTTDETLTVVREEDVDAVVSKVRSYLREATRARANRPGAAHQEDGHYRVSRSDLHGLLCHVLDDADDLTQDVDGFHGPALSPLPGNSTTPSDFQSPRILKPNHSITSLPVQPAITLSVPEASFTLALDLPSGGPHKRNSAATAAIVSPSNVTKVTWPSSPD